MVFWLVSISGACVHGCHGHCKAPENPQLLSLILSHYMGQNTRLLSLMLIFAPDTQRPLDCYSDIM